jgi:hypothetical protein
MRSASTAAERGEQSGATLLPDPRSRLEAMTPPERREAARRGALSRHELALWASLYPTEPPLVNGELPWIALGLADLD